MIGSTVDKYEVLQKVGEGGMATVYRGRHTTLDRDVAIKVLHPHLSSSTRNRKRFAREARAIEHLRHENILEIFDYSGIDSGDCYIITEFVDGDTLTAVLDEHGRLPSELVASIGVKLCEALGYAHESGILHRDMKPDNVMVRRDGTVKLMDFGIARFLDESHITLTGALVGSPAFMSPEQAVEDPLDTRSDLFSLGTMLFYLVAGELPFTGSNPSLILKNVIEGNRPNITELVPEVSPTLADVIERLMATSPEGRFNTARDVGEALQAVLDEVELDGAESRWSVAAWLEEPGAYLIRLHEHITEVLLRVGKNHLDAGDALSALRQFNRLLAIDEENEEVLGLVGSLHVEPERERRPVLGFGLGLAALVMVCAAMIGWYARSTQPETVPAPTPQVLDPLPTPEPESPVPEPEPVVPVASPAPVPVPVIVAPARPVPAPAPEPEPLEQLPSGPATLRIVSNMAADVYEGNKKLGTTRRPLELTPGAHILEVRSDVIQSQELRVEVGPGERIERVLRLEAKPARIRLANRFADDCQVELDGVVLGRVSDLGRVIEVPRPDQPGHRLNIRCGTGSPFEHVWSTVVLPGQVLGQ